MDQKRFIAFLALSMAVFLLSGMLFPQPKPPQPQAPAADADNKDAGPAAAADAGQPPDAPPGAEDQPPVAPPGPAADLAAPADTAPTQYVTLGSLDFQSGYRLLVTLTNQGAAVQRVELSSPRFRDQQDRSGYLGQLVLVDTQGVGVKAQVVGPGTPAAVAGLEPDDVIVGIGQSDGKTSAVTSVDQWGSLLAETKPGQKITLDVKRGERALQLSVKLGWRPLEIIRPEIENVLMRGVKPPKDFEGPPSFLVTLASYQGQPLKAAEAARVASWLRDGHWEITQHDEKSVTFRRALPAWNLEILKRYTIDTVPPPSLDDKNYPGYGIKLDVELRNTGAEPQQVGYQLDGPNGLPMEGWWYAHKIGQGWGGAGLRDVVVRFDGANWLQISPTKIVDDKTEPMGQDRGLAYAGVDAQYFSAVLLPLKPLAEVWFDTTEAVLVGAKPDAGTPKSYANVTCRMTRKPIALDPGETRQDSFNVFLGPKRPDLLEQYQAGDDPKYSLKDLVYYGWFSPVARVMLVVLHFFYSIIGNYGIAIILLTVLVRGAMFPISFRQTRNMARMQALKPELDRITEKYKGDSQKKQQAMQELYKKNKINPLGGCLPLFIQMPVFIGLYRSLMIDVELRQSALFGHWTHWCSDLAAPDMLYNWSSFMPQSFNDGIGLLALGPYLNVLPLVTVGLFLVTQKLSMPAAANEQAAMQQKMMKYMTMFMGVLFYKVASGLCLYFIASSLWGITERKLLPKPSKDNDGAAGGSSGAKADKPSGSAGQNGSPARRKAKGKKQR